MIGCEKLGSNRCAADPDLHRSLIRPVCPTATADTISEMRTTSAIVGIVGLLLATVPAAGGVYGPDERILITVRPDGTAEELSFGFDPPGRFNLALDRLADMCDLNPKRTNNKQRDDVLARIAAHRGDPTTAADLLRTRQADAVINLIAPKARGRTATFAIFANLAHAHAVRGAKAEVNQATLPR